MCVNAIEARAILRKCIRVRGRLSPLASRTLFFLKNSMGVAAVAAVAAVGSFAELFFHTRLYLFSLTCSFMI